MSDPTKSTLITLLDEPAVVSLRIAPAACVSVPLVPAILKVELPIVAPVMTLSVEVPEVVMDAGEKVGVDPASNPVTDKFTVPANPFSAATVTVKVAVPPGATDVEPGETTTLKSGAITLSVEVAECTRELFVPVIEIVELLAELPAAVETVRVEVPDPPSEGGEKVGVAPAGKPLAVKVTVSLNPFRGATVTV
jgi:hypothetical protein